MTDQPGTPAAPPTTGPRAAPGAASSGYLLGGVALVLLILATAVLFSYTLLDLPWQQRWGAWNYVVGAGLTVSMAVPLRRWRPITA